MNRFLLAFSCFFRLLFGKLLRPEVAPWLPDELKALPPGSKKKKEPELVVEKKDLVADRFVERAPEKSVDKSVDKIVERAPEKPKKSDAVAQREGALALLGLLQREGRLVDFLREPLDTYADADIGAAARDVHRGCKKVMDQIFKLEPVMPGKEDEKVSVPKGFDPSEVRLIGEAKGEPPFRGTLRHHGWRAIDASLPQLTDGVDRTVVAPAEVEV
jgi:hypothetical protein